MATVLIYTYNNYYNRKFKKHDNLADYAAGLVYTETGNALNFNPADGVNTTFVAGRQNNPYSTEGDYLIYTEDNVNIKSRWFIIENRKNRQGQSVLTLRRDVIADYYDNIISDKMFIKKATIAENSPFIINQEPIAVNQIKKSEFELKDDSHMAWIVGFVDRKAFESGDITVTSKANIVPSIVKDSLTDWEFNKYVDKVVKTDDFSIPGLMSINMYFINDIIPGKKEVGKKLSYSLLYDGTIINENDYSEKPQSGARITGSILNFSEYFKNAIKNAGYTESVHNNCIKAYAPAIDDIGMVTYLDLLNLKDKIIQTTGTTKAYYRININNYETTQKVRITDNKVDSVWLKTQIDNIFKAYSNYTQGEPYIEIEYKYDNIEMTLEKLDDSDITLTMKKNHFSLKDAPYDMFCIPYADGVHLYPRSVYSNKSMAMRLAQAIGSQLGSFIYDIQLLPFCPMTGYVATNEYFDINTTDEGRFNYYNNVVDDKPVGMIYWATASQGTFNIIKEIALNNKKIDNQCDLWRIVSPNYNGQFEFSVAKNNGVNYFNVDFTYLPYSSYIHINPNFKSFYGQDFNDARGLICQGDFSICYLSDKWVEYQINNKNYNNIFNRQIENMDVNHKYDRAGQIVSGIAGAIGVGTAVGGMGGGVAGGVAAGAASLIGAGVDIAISESKYKESKSYAEDIFNYQLDNIKAMPNSIAKTTAYTANNKIFPIVEYYTCTEEEKIAIAEEIANAGMTLGVVGELENYILNEWSYNGIKDRGFIQAKPITLSIEEDYHLASAISEELEKGVYFK